MPRYRRYFSDGQTVFLTLTTAERRPWLSHEEVKERLLDALRATRRLYPFKHHGHVLLHDHLHLLLSPHDGVEVPRIVGSFKRAAIARLSNFSSAFGGRAWQRRYYDHLIRDEQDFSPALQPGEARIGNLCSRLDLVELSRVASTRYLSQGLGKPRTRKHSRHDRVGRPYVADASRTTRIRASGA